MQSALAQCFIHPTGRCTDRDAVASLAVTYRLEALGDADIGIARDIGAALIGETLASADLLSAIQRATHNVVFGFREDGALTGMMALLPLRQAGHALLLAGRFDARAPDLDLVARPGEAPACYYAWGIAATSKHAARAMIQFSSTLHQTLFWDIPSFTRAVTGDGVRLMGSFGYRPINDADPQLIMAPPPGRPPNLVVR